MLLNHIKNCNTFYNYGEIENNIISDSFLWNEDEEKKLLPVLEYLDMKSNKKYLYLITTHICFYPIGTKDKYLRLWKRLSKEYDLYFDETSEKGVEAKRFYIYSGVAKISQEQLLKAFQILQRQFYTSCIILSDENKNLDDLLSEYIDCYLKKDMNCVDFKSLINTLCIKDEVITAITGYNGSSINYFYYSR